MSEWLDIEMAFSIGGVATLRRLKLKAPANVDDALRELLRHPGAPPSVESTCTVGIFGRVVARTHPLKEGDRVEIYRPLLNDPKELRRARAKRTRY